MIGRPGSPAVLAALVAIGSGCGSPSAGAVDGPPLEAAVRPDTPGNGRMFNFEPDDVLETFGSTGGFLVHFTRGGPNAVPGADVPGVPDFVEEVASIYDQVLARYTELGFRAPLADAENGGDARFDVYLVDFNGVGDGVFRTDGCPGPVCSGYMVQENDYEGYGYPSTQVANRILGSHEFFHAVQAAYDGGQGSIFAEGTAVWATETFDGQLHDFEGFVDGYLDHPDRSLDVPLPGPVDPFSYGSAIFFRFLDERFGVDTIRKLLERTEDGANGVDDPVWFHELDGLLKAEAGSSFAEALSEFATWNLFTGDLADPERAYADGEGYPDVVTEDEVLPYSDPSLRLYYASTQYFEVEPAGRAAVGAALVCPADEPDEAADLTMFLAVERNGTWDPIVRVADPLAGSETVQTTDSARVVVAIVNGRTSGESRRPGLCIGTVEEIASCKSVLVVSTGTGGSGGADGIGGGASAPPPRHGEPGAEDPEGCGCRVASAPVGSDLLSPALAAGALAIYLARRRRSRHAAA